MCAARLTHDPRQATTPQKNHADPATTTAIAPSPNRPRDLAHPRRGKARHQSPDGQTHQEKAGQAAGVQPPARDRRSRPGVPQMLLDTLRAVAPPRTDDEPAIALLSAGWEDPA
jgi:hypothetical protein